MLLDVFMCMYCTCKCTCTCTLHVHVVSTSVGKWGRSGGVKGEGEKGS